MRGQKTVLFNIIIQKFYFISTSVNTNKSTWEHEILVDSNFPLQENYYDEKMPYFKTSSDVMEDVLRINKRANVRTLLPQLATNYSVRQKTYRMIHKEARDLTTFVELHDKLSVLHVSGLQNR